MKRYLLVLDLGELYLMTHKSFFLDLLRIRQLQGYILSWAHKSITSPKRQTFMNRPDRAFKNTYGKKQAT